MKTKLLLKATLVALVFGACSSEDPAATNDLNKYTKAADSDTGGESEYNVRQLQDNALQRKTQKFIFDTDEGEVVFETESGTIININTETLTVKGDHVGGTAILEYVEIFGRSNMVTTNKTTMGVTEEQSDEIEGIDLAPLVSGGEFFINITTEEGEQFDDGAEITLSVPTELTTGDFDEEMDGWEGEENDEGDVIWKLDEGDPIAGGDGYYLFNPPRFGWCNIDVLRAENGETTTILVDVPDGFDDTNTNVYLAIAGEVNTLAPLDTYDYNTELFSEHYGQVPVGLDGYIIFVSGTNNQWLYAIIPVTFAPNDIIVVDQGDIVAGTQADLENAVDSLQ